MANHVKVRRKQLGLTLQQIADAIDTTKATVMKLEKGQMQLTENWLERLSEPLECSPQDLIAEVWPSNIPVIGLVMEKGVLALFRPLPKKGLGESEHYWQGLEEVERPPESGYRQVVALKVQGESMQPFLGAGSIIYAGDPIEKDFKKYFNRQVVCQLKNGTMVLCRLMPGSVYGRYHLASLVNPDDKLNNSEINWCAKVIFFKPV